MRGTHRHQSPQLAQRGIIPAYAGNTKDLRPSCCGCRDHPRVCGEHCEARALRLYKMGSSPRMRGTLVHYLPHFFGFGIIPAYAGNTCSVLTAMRRARDHPRVCGEHTGRTPPTRATWGSSPRMRGTHVKEFLAQTDDGIIPAYAGNTKSFVYCDSVCRDHPRVCGEHTKRL